MQSECDESRNTIRARKVLSRLIRKKFPSRRLRRLQKRTYKSSRRKFFNSYPEIYAIPGSNLIMSLPRVLIKLTRFEQFNRKWDSISNKFDLSFAIHFWEATKLNLSCFNYYFPLSTRITFLNKISEPTSRVGYLIHTQQFQSVLPQPNYSKLTIWDEITETIWKTLFAWLFALYVVVSFLILNNQNNTSCISLI